LTAATQVNQKRGAKQYARQCKNASLARVTDTGEVGSAMLADFVTGLFVQLRDTAIKIYPF
jgi:hypothetical protein